MTFPRFTKPGLRRTVVMYYLILKFIDPSNDYYYVLLGPRVYEYKYILPRKKNRKENFELLYIIRQLYEKYLDKILPDMASNPNALEQPP